MLIKRNSLKLIMCLLMPILFSGCFYYKPSYKGKVVDADTKQPLSGVVVVVMYHRGVLLDKDFELIKAKEYVTGADGVFKFPPYITLIAPFTLPTYSKFIMFKPGYGRYSLSGISWKAIFGLDEIEKFFSEDYGKKKELHLYTHGRLSGHEDSLKKYSAIYGEAELKIITSMSRKDSMEYMNYIKFYEIKGLPNLEKAMQAGEKWLSTVIIND